MMRRLLVSGLGFALTTAAAVAQAQPAPVVLAPHRVVYDLALAASSGSRGVESARGRIVYDFTGDTCEGYALKYRQVTVLESGESGTKTSDLRTATFEGGDGRSFRFRTDNSSAGTSEKTVQGDAERSAAELRVRLRDPKAERFALPGDPAFPSDHLKRLVVAARAGERTLTVQVYDGSDDGRKIYDTLAVIGRPIAPGVGEGLEDAAKIPELAKITRWPVKLSYFAPGQGERTPIYSIAFELYENGVSRDLKLDYGEFALDGRMTKLEMLPVKACSR
jgi:hypothetical protein